MNARICWIFFLLPFLGSCASRAGEWTRSYAGLDRNALSTEVPDSLRSQGWEPFPTKRASFDEAWQKGNPHKTRLYITFDGKGGMSLEAKSQHSINWLTVGILGRSMAGQSAQVVEEWLATFDQLIATEYGG